MEPWIMWKLNADHVYAGLLEDVSRVAWVFLTFLLCHLLLREGKMEPWLEVLFVEAFLFSMLGLAGFHLIGRLVVQVTP